MLAILKHKDQCHKSPYSCCLHHSNARKKTALISDKNRSVNSINPVVIKGTGIQICTALRLSANKGEGGEAQ